MCLDIDPDSVIHRHLINKVTNSIAQDERPVTTWFNYKHNLTMLPSFHISLGVPPPGTQIKTESINLHKYQLHELIGIIALADINISKNQNKKSAWISINETKFNLAHRISDFSFYNSENLHLHISLANLTGNPHDSIARPEDCIIDTITA